MCGPCRDDVVCSSQHEMLPSATLHSLWSIRSYEAQSHKPNPRKIRSYDFVPLPPSDLPDGQQQPTDQVTAPISIESPSGTQRELSDSQSINPLRNDQHAAAFAGFPVYHYFAHPPAAMAYNQFTPGAYYSPYSPQHASPQFTYMGMNSVQQPVATGGPSWSAPALPTPGQQAQRHATDLRRQVLETNMMGHDQTDAEGMPPSSDQRDSASLGTPSSSRPLVRQQLKIVHSCDPADVEMVTHFKWGKFFDRGRLTKKVKVPRPDGEVEEVWRCNKPACQSCIATQHETYLTQRVARSHGLSNILVRKSARGEMVRPGQDSVVAPSQPIQQLGSSDQPIIIEEDEGEDAVIMNGVVALAHSGSGQATSAVAATNERFIATGGDRPMQLQLGPQSTEASCTTPQAPTLHEQASMLGIEMTDTTSQATARENAEKSGWRPMSYGAQIAASKERIRRAKRAEGMSDEAIQALLDRETDDAQAAPSRSFSP